MTDCGSMDISYSEAMQMTLREIKRIAKGKNNARVAKINDSLYISHTQAILDALANHGSKQFPKEAPKVELKDNKEETKNDKVNAMHDLAKQLCRNVGR